MSTRSDDIQAALKLLSVLPLMFPDNTAKESIDELLEQYLERREELTQRLGLLGVGGLHWDMATLLEDKSYLDGIHNRLKKDGFIMAPAIDHVVFSEDKLKNITAKAHDRAFIIKEVFAAPIMGTEVTKWSEPCYVSVKDLDEHIKEENEALARKLNSNG